MRFPYGTSGCLYWAVLVPLAGVGVMLLKEVWG